MRANRSYELCLTTRSQPLPVDFFCRLVLVVGWAAPAKASTELAARTPSRFERPSGPWYSHAASNRPATVATGPLEWSRLSGWFVPAWDVPMPRWEDFFDHSVLASLPGANHPTCTVSLPNSLLSVFFFSLHPSFHPNNAFVPPFSPISPRQPLRPTTILAFLPAPPTPSSFLARHTAAACNSSLESVGPC